MCAYIGTKSVLATTMTRGEYNHYRNWDIPENEDPSEQGYLVEYVDGGKPNDERHKGYISWSPACVFKDAYRPNGSLNFGDALYNLKLGKKVARSGWNGKGMWLALVDTGYYDVGCSVVGEINLLLPWIGMKTADNKFVPWLASQTDVLAEDWQIVE